MREFGNDNPVDYFISNMTIDAKYRIGSGDSVTLKKFKQYGEMLIDKGYIPTFLILRIDNFPAAIPAPKSVGWNIYTDESTFNFIIRHSGFDVIKELVYIKTNYLT